MRIRVDLLILWLAAYNCLQGIYCFHIYPDFNITGQKFLYKKFYKNVSISINKSLETENFHFYNSQLKMAKYKIQDSYAQEVKKKKSSNVLFSKKSNDLFTLTKFFSLHHKILSDNFKLSQDELFEKVKKDLNMSHENEYLVSFAGNPFGFSEDNKIEKKLNPSGKDIGDFRRKRSAFNLFSMMLCTNNCNPFSYKGYGCYCGFLGSGRPVDGIDKCCQRHDECYTNTKCSLLMYYFMPYFWNCIDQEPICGMDQKTTNTQNSCAQGLCECDKELVLCLKYYPCPRNKALCTSSFWRLLQNILFP